jgi:hypothetical protein
MTARRHPYRGPYAARQRRLIAWARANPTTAHCAKCLRTMAELEAHATGRAPWWVAGHIVRGVADSPLQLECSHCSNFEPHRTTALTWPTSEDPYR